MTTWLNIKKVSKVKIIKKILIKFLLLKLKMLYCFKIENYSKFSFFYLVFDLFSSCCLLIIVTFINQKLIFILIIN
jgi:hypothetical protein